VPAAGDAVVGADGDGAHPSGVLPAVVLDELLEQRQAGRQHEHPLRAQAVGDGLGGDGLAGAACHQQLSPLGGFELLKDLADRRALVRSGLLRCWPHRPRTVERLQNGSVAGRPSGVPFGGFDLGGGPHAHVGGQLLSSGPAERRVAEQHQQSSGERPAAALGDEGGDVLPRDLAVPAPADLDLDGDQAAVAVLGNGVDAAVSFCVLVLLAVLSCPVAPAPDADQVLAGERIAGDGEPGDILAVVAERLSRRPVQAPQQVGQRA